MIDKILKEQFPIVSNHLYFDHAGISPISKRVGDKISQFIKEYSEGGGFYYDTWMKRVDNARAVCAKLIGAEVDEIAFIKSTSHGISLVASGLKWEKGDNVIVYQNEFPSNIYPWMNLENQGVEIKFIKGNQGRIEPSEIGELIDANSRLLALSSVQYTNGFRSDLKSIGKLCNERGIYFFVDAVQSLGIIPMDVKENCIDFLAANGHKWLMSPEGTGIFYCKKENIDALSPSLVGWNSVINESEYGTIDFTLKPNSLKFEEGSLNALGIIALGAAVELLLNIGIDEIQSKIYELGDYLISNIEERGFIIKSPLERKYRAGITSFVGNFEPQDLKDKLYDNNIVVNFRGEAIRVSPHFYNDLEQLDLLFKAIDKIV